MGRTAKQALIIAFQGEHGAFSEEAGRHLADANAAFSPCESFPEVFESVANGRADSAIIPIENTLHGSVHQNYDLLLAHKLTIVAETQLRIVHHLIAAPGTKLRQIQRVYSHPVALNQCLAFFDSHPAIEKATFYDTAGSVKMLMETEQREAGAIASEAAAALYGAAILKRGIEDDRRNFTRFFLIQRDAVRRAKSGEWKTSLVFTTRNQPGALFRALSAFALRDLSLTKIESRPLRGKPWEYLFYLDFLGSADDPVAQRALLHLSEIADMCRILGSYPRGA